MQIDLYAKSQELLERLANSIHDRNSKVQFVFTLNEMHIAEDWIRDLLKEVNQEITP